MGEERRKVAVKTMAMLTVMAYGEDADHDNDHDQDQDQDGVVGVEEGYFEEGWSERER